MTEQQPISTEEAEERELEEAEEAFYEDTGNPEEAAADMQADTARTEKEETAKENQHILAALGFKPYHDAGVTKYSIRVMNVKIGVTFNEINPLGKIWAYKIPEGDEEKEFLKNGDLKAHPLIQKYQVIQEGKEPIPEITVTGKIVERRGGAIIIAITENGEKKECSFGLGAVKKDNDGAFIPAGFSKATEKNSEQKMDIPRDIRLFDYETQLAQAPVADTTKEKPVLKEKGEKVDKGTVADKIPPSEPEPREEAIATTMKTYLEKGREMVEQIFPELEQPQLSELSQDIATSMFIEDRKEARKERW